MPYFYDGDTVHERGVVDKFGVVVRTPLDVDTLGESLAEAFPDGLKRHKSVSKDAYRNFLGHGIPPKDTVVVTWCITPWSLNDRSTLVKIQALELVDRELLLGDFVKKSPDAHMSGVIINDQVFSSLLPLKSWPQPTGVYATLSEADVAIGWFEDDPARQLRHIPAEDLKWTMALEDGDTPFVIFKNEWFGKCEASYQACTLRLANGSIVTVEDADDLQPLNLDFDEGQRCEMGQFVQTRKANLRRGQWRFGAYDANIEPVGVVIDLRTTTIEVAWLCCKPEASIDEPPYELSLDDLEPGELAYYNVYRRPATAQDSEPYSSLGLAIGDKVRFRDGVAAAEKYNATNSEGNGVFNRIPRQQTMGYDTNTFMVVSNRTNVTVRWQDLTTSTHPSTELVPALDISEDHTIWPGELVVARGTISESADVIRPASVGILQEVQAKKRFANVRWFKDPDIGFATDSEASFFPGSYTGVLADAAEIASVYDLATIPHVARRLGDMVQIKPDLSQKAMRLIEFPTSAEDRLTAQAYQTAVEICDGTSGCGWIGEVRDLTTHGLLTVRLHAHADGVKDVQVPWECTVVVWSSDRDDDDEMDTFDDDAEHRLNGDHASGTESGSDDSDMIEEDEVWEDEEGHPIDMNDEAQEWVDEDEDEDNVDDEDAMDIDVASGAELHTPIPPPQPHDVGFATTGLLENGQVSAAMRDQGSFTYEQLLRNTALPSFQVLDGQAPPSHHFYSGVREGSATSKFLRRIVKEHSALSTSLPAGVYVRTFESSLHLLRLLIIGPVDTPYEYAPFLIDLFLPPNYPSEAPQAFFHSWDEGSGPINPNLYVDGNICLSLLGTWPGASASESWNPDTSTLLQLIVSLLGLVLVKNPFYNEAGFDIRAGSADSKLPAEVYAERTYFNSRRWISAFLSSAVVGFEDVRQAVYESTSSSGGSLLLRATSTALECLHCSRAEGDVVIDPPNTVSHGATIPLVRQIERLIGHVEALGLRVRSEQQSIQSLADMYRCWLKDPKAEYAGLLGSDKLMLLDVVTA